MTIYRCQNSPLKFEKDKFCVMQYLFYVILYFVLPKNSEFLKNTLNSEKILEKMSHVLRLYCLYN